MQLRDFPTLNHVAVGAGADRRQTAASASAPTAAAARRMPVAVPVSTVRGDLAAVRPLPRRLPVPVAAARGSTGACRPASPSPGARVVVMLDEGGVGAALCQAAGGAGATAADPRARDLGRATSGAALDAWLADGPGRTASTGSPRSTTRATLPDPDGVGRGAAAPGQEPLRRPCGGCGPTARSWSPPPGSGGYHGYDEAGATAPLGGAVTGFAKSYKKERPDALVKAVDFPASRKTAALADLLIEETLRDPGCVEVGRVDGRRFGVAFREVPFTAARRGRRPARRGRHRARARTRWSW